jgi:hypothetical protein
MEKFDRDSLLLEALSLFDLNEISCDVTLKYFEKLMGVRGNFFHRELRRITFLLHAKLTKIKQYDEKAYKLSKVKTVELLHVCLLFLFSFCRHSW